MEPGPVAVSLSGRAARWIQLLQEFGHLDAGGADRLIVAAADLHAELGVPGDRIDLGTVRRAAAMVLFPTGPHDPSPVLEDDWPLLFS